MVFIILFVELWILFYNFLKLVHIMVLIEKVHFDVNKPQNHNIYISNLKNKYIMIYDGNKWECKDRENQNIDR